MVNLTVLELKAVEQKYVVSYETTRKQNTRKLLLA